MGVATADDTVAVRVTFWFGVMLLVLEVSVACVATGDTTSLTAALVAAL
jgi:hypothetical protein